MSQKLMSKLTLNAASIYGVDFPMEERQLLEYDLVSGAHGLVNSIDTVLMSVFSPS